MKKVFQCFCITVLLFTCTSCICLTKYSQDITQERPPAPKNAAKKFGLIINISKKLVSFDQYEQRLSGQTFTMTTTYWKEKYVPYAYAYANIDAGVDVTGIASEYLNVEPVFVLDKNNISLDEIKNGASHPEGKKGHLFRIHNLIIIADGYSDSGTIHYIDDIGKDNLVYTINDASDWPLLGFDYYILFNVEDTNPYPYGLYHILAAFTLYALPSFTNDVKTYSLLLVSGKKEVGKCLKQCNLTVTTDKIYSLPLAIFGTAFSGPSSAVQTEIIIRNLLQQLQQAMGSSGV